MGRKNKIYNKDLHHQAYEKLTDMQAFNESKKDAIAQGTERDKIFSYNTFKTYWKHIQYFIKYIEKNHPEITSLKKARKYVPEWLQSRVEQVDKNGKHLSAWTIQTEAKALSKLYGIQPDDEDYFTPPRRNRKDITRSRVDRVRDKHFSKTNNDELIKFCRGTGLRRSELEKLQGKDLVTKEQIESAIAIYEAKKNPTERDISMLETLKDTRLFDAEFFLYIKGKGGRERVSPIVGKNQEQIIERIKNTQPNEKVWKYVSSNADIHGYRSEYATQIYKLYAREIESIPYDRVNQGTGKRFQSDVYTCRKDEKGKKLDKQAMYKCSKALGHNRICVVADNYIRGL